MIKFSGILGWKWSFFFYLLQATQKFSETKFWTSVVKGNGKIQLSLQKAMKLPIKNFFSKCDQIRGKQLLKKSLMENLLFCAVYVWMGRVILSRSRRLCEKINQLEKNSSSCTTVTAIRFIPLLKVNIKIFHADS